MAFFSLALDQQYYHFVLLRDSGGYSLNEYWNQIQACTKMPSFNFDGCEIQHRQIQTNVQYFRGEQPEITSLDNNQNPQFRYDLIAFRVRTSTNNFVVLSFPFASLARDVLMRVSLNSEFKRKCDFLKVNVPLLIKRHVPLYEPEETTVKVMGLTVSISKKNNTVTSLSLSGNNPLDSDIYRTFLQTPISIDEAIPKNCILFFEIPYPRTNQSNLLTPSKLRSRIHINSHGNFIFYVHIGGDNFCIIRTFINYLNDLNALETASTNPFLVIKRVEGLDENNVGS